MATITVQVQSLLNTAQYDSYTLADTSTISTLKSSIFSNTSVNSNWYALYYNSELLANANTLASYGITSNTQLRSANKISRLPTLEDRQKAKLALAGLDREAAGYPNYTANIATLPTQFSGNTIVDNPNPDGLLEGRPWIS